MKAQISLILVLAIIFQPIFALGAAQRTIQADQIQSADTTKTYSLPGASDALVGTGASQTLTNKTLTSPVMTAPSADYLQLNQAVPSGTPASGKAFLYAKPDGTIATAKSDGTEVVMAPGTNFVNYFAPNYNAENGILGWATYKESTAAALPSTGTGGTSGVSFARTTSNPLEGSYSYTLTKPATNQQGSGLSFDFKVPYGEARQQRTQRLSFVSSVISGTYVAGDAKVSILDVTNNKLMSLDAGQGVALDANASSEFSATWVPSANSTLYRFILHISSTSALAYSLALDSFLMQRDPYIGLSDLSRSVGEVFPIGGSTCPAGAIDADGSAVSRTTYGDLFTVSGTTYGAGDGSTTFNVINMKGVFMRGDGSQTVGGKTFTGTLGTSTKDSTAKNGLYDSGHNHITGVYEDAGGNHSTFGAYPAAIGSGAAPQNWLGGGYRQYTSATSANLVGDAETAPANVAVHYCVQTKKAQSLTTYTPDQLMDVMGVVTYQAGATCGQGSLVANGAAVSRTSYSALFGKLGTLYGAGDGSTTFNLPDLRGVFVRGAGTAGTLTNASGTAYSATLGASQNDQLQGHWHTVVDPSTGGGKMSLNSGSTSGIYTVPNNASTATGPGWQAQSPVSDGSNGTPRAGAETRPANVALTPCISYVAVQAPRIVSSSAGDFKADGSVAMTGALNAGSNKIINLATPTASTDATTKAYVDSAVSAASPTGYVKADGSVPMTGALSLGSFKVTNLAAPTASTDGATKGYVDTAISGVPTYDLSPYFKRDGSVTATGAFNLGSFKLTNVATPTATGDAATKGYVDSAISGIPATDTSSFVKIDGTRAFTADQSFGSHKATNVLTPTASTDAANKAYVDAAVAAVPAPDLSAYFKKDGSVAATGNFNMGSHKLTSVTDPTNAQDAATKSYVDGKVAGLGTGNGDFKADGSVPMTGTLNMGVGNSIAWFNADTSVNMGIGYDPAIGSSGRNLVAFNKSNLYINAIDGTLSIGSHANDTTNVFRLTSSALSFYGALSMNNHAITNVSDPVNAQDVATKAYVDAHSSSGGGSGDFKADGTVPMTAALNAGSFKVINVANATADGDAVSLGKLKDVIQNGTSTSTTGAGLVLDNTFDTDGVKPISPTPGAPTGQNASRFAVMPDGTSAFFQRYQNVNNGGTYESDLTIIDASGNVNNVVLPDDGFNENSQGLLAGNDGYFYLITTNNVTINANSPFGGSQPVGIAYPAIRRFDTSGVMDTSFGPNSDGTATFDDQTNNYDGTNNPWSRNMTNFRFFTSDGKIHLFTQVDIQNQQDPMNPGNTYDNFSFEHEVYDTTTNAWDISDTLAGNGGSNLYQDDGNGGNQNSAYNPSLALAQVSPNGSHYYAAIRYDNGSITAVRDGANASGSPQTVGILMDNGDLVTYAYSGQGYAGVFRVVKLNGSTVDSSTAMPTSTNGSVYSPQGLYHLGGRQFAMTTTGPNADGQSPEISVYTMPSAVNAGDAFTTDYTHQTLVYPTGFSGYPNYQAFGYASTLNKLLATSSDNAGSTADIYLSRYTGGTTTVTITVKPGDLMKDGSVKMTGDLDADGHRIKKVQTNPTADTDAINKAYLDNRLSSFTAPLGGTATADIDLNYHALSRVGDLYAGNSSGAQLHIGSNSTNAYIGMGNSINNSKFSLNYDSAYGTNGRVRINLGGGGPILFAQDDKMSFGNAGNALGSAFIYDATLNKAQTSQTPTNAADIVNKVYVDNAVAAIPSFSGSTGASGLSIDGDGSYVNNHLKLKLDSTNNENPLQQFIVGNVTKMDLAFQNGIGTDTLGRSYLGFHGGNDLYMTYFDSQLSFSNAPNAKGNFYTNGSWARYNATPTNALDVTNKSYVDTAISTALSTYTPPATLTTYGNSTTPTVISGSGVPFTATTPFTVMFVKGQGSGTLLSVGSQIANATTTGQRLTLVGQDSIAYIHFVSGGNVKLKNGNSELYLYAQTSAEFIWDGQNWEQL